MRFATRSGQKLIFILVFHIHLIHFSYCEYDTGSQITFETYTNKKSSDYSEYFYRNDSVAGNAPFNDTENSTLPSSSKVGFSSERPVYPTLDNPLFRQVFTSINTEERHVHHFQFNVSTLAVWSAFQLQLYAEADQPLDILNQDPLVVTAHWQGTIKSWKIPVTFVNETVNKDMKRYSDNIVSKTVWPNFKGQPQTKSVNLTVEVSSFSDAKLYYKLRIILLRDFVVRPSVSIKEIATPSSPAIFKFTIPEGWEYAFVHAVSDDDVCTMMTVQEPIGPFIEMDDHHQKKVKLTETFTKKTGMTVKVSDYPQGFLLVFVPFSNDEKCVEGTSNATTGSTDNTFRKKEITFQIREGPYPMNYLKPVFIPLLLFALITVCVIVFMVVSHHFRHKTIVQEKNWVIHRCLSQFTIKITIEDLIVTDPSRVVDQSRRYCTAGFVTSAFYSVPVFQLIFTIRKQLDDTGDLDLCYFNDFCSHPLYIFKDFNHMYSNIWYILFGILYVIMVRIRQLTSDLDFTSNRGKKNPFVCLFFHRASARMDRGAMTNYGLLYCMGLTLIMTGVMSGAYHICPNQRNFQFDTVFMYTIAAITVVTLYQARHPTYLSANFTFTALVLVAIITVLGLLWEQFYVRVIFSVLHMLFLLFTLPKVCYNGYIRKNDRLVVHWLEVMRILWIKFKEDFKKNRILKIQREIWYAPNTTDATMIIHGPGRVIVPGLLLLMNCMAIAGMWTVFLGQNFATQVLYICVANGAFYIVCYSGLKIWHGECRRGLWIQPLLYLLASFVLWGTAMSFFMVSVSTWESSPAVSRTQNMECTVLSFYDSHDMWHFLSAAALFCSAMVLLTVDDDLVDQPKSTIPVF